MLLSPLGEELNKSGADSLYFLFFLGGHFLIAGDGKLENWEAERESLFMEIVGVKFNLFYQELLQFGQGLLKVINGTPHVFVSQGALSVLDVLFHQQLLARLDFIVLVL